MPRITSEDFDEWIDNPVTQYFRQYLKDSRKEAAKMVADDIANGVTVPLNNQIQTATMCETLMVMSEIEHEVIEDFYREGE